MMNQIGPAELRTWMDNARAFALIDVREEWEHAAFNIGGTLLPLGYIMAAQDKIPKDMPVVIYCEKGIRSVVAIQRLEGLGFQNLYNLTGGMKAWRSDFQ